MPRNSERAGTVARLVLVGLAVGAGAMLATQLPDLRRYLTMRSM